MVLVLWSATHDRKFTVIVRFSSFTHKRSLEEGDTFHGGRGPGSFYLVSLPSFIHSFHFQAQHGYSLQQDGERAGWRACLLQSRTPPRNLLHHFRLHPKDQNLDTRQHLAIMKVRQYRLHSQQPHTQLKTRDSIIKEEGDNQLFHDMGMSVLFSECVCPAC